MKIMQSFLGFFYPNKCMLCQNLLTLLEEEQYICSRCEEKLILETRPLKHLYRQNAKMQDDEIVIQTDTPAEVVALFPYEAEYRKAILRWKYQGVRKYAKGFAKLLAHEIDFTVYEEAIFIPIPLAPSRKRKRGYNQALDLANEISKLTHIPVVDCLVRYKDTKPQSQCSREERMHNIKNTMSIKKYMCEEPKSILLIDDIYTTGSTIKEAIQIINTQYAFRNARICVIVVGKGEL